MSAKIAKVLVVDDDDAVRELIKALLEQSGYEVRDAADGEIALTLLKAEPADIVLLDILMPRKEGLETLIELKQHFPKMTVFAMSASGARKGHDFLTIASKFGADGVLQKPFSPDELFALINSRSAAQSRSTAPTGR
jgi:DNA-binding response OmpR family regulator